MAHSLVNLLPLSFRSVFSHIFYITLLIALALTLWIIFNLFEQLIFFLASMGILLTRRCTAWTCSDYHHSDFVGYIEKYEYLCHKKFKAKDNQVFIILWHRTKYIVQYMCQLLFNWFSSNLYIWRIRNSDI